MRILTLLTLASTLALAQRPGPKLTPDLAKVSEHVQAIWGFPVIVFVIGDAGMLAIDTGLGPANGKIVADTARQIAPGKKLFLTTTHFHPEHAAGEGGFPPETVILRAAAQQKELEQRHAELLTQFRRNAEFGPYLDGADKLRTPDITFDEAMRLDLGGVSVRLLWYGAGHTEGDEMIFVEQDRVLITGDIVQNKVVPGVATGNLESWLRVLAKLELLKPVIVVPTHSRVGDGSLIAQEKAFIEDIRTRTLALKRQGVAVADASARMTDYFRSVYPEWVANTDWTNVSSMNGLVQRIYTEDK